MTGSEHDWAPFHDAKHYEADALSGQVRSLPRRIKGRDYPGTDPLKCRPDGDGYMRFNYRDDAGVRHEAASRARCMLMAHDPGGYFEGAEACHGPGGRQDDRLANLRWDTKDANREEALALRLVNSPPKVKPPKTCPRCGAEHAGKGRNCHQCVVGLGVQAARLLAAEVRLQEVADRLDYPAEPLHHLAFVYGGARTIIVDAEVALSEPHAGHSVQSAGKSRSVLFRLKAWLADSDGE